MSAPYATVRMAREEAGSRLHSMLQETFVNYLSLLRWDLSSMSATLVHSESTSYDTNFKGQSSMGTVSQSETHRLPSLVTPVVFLLLGLPSTCGRRQFLLPLKSKAMPYPRNMDFPSPVIPSFMIQHHDRADRGRSWHNFSFYPLLLALNLLTS